MSNAGHGVLLSSYLKKQLLHFDPFLKKKFEVNLEKGRKNLFLFACDFCVNMTLNGS